MADTKISDLPAVTDVLTTDEYVLARGGVTNKIDAVDLQVGLLAYPSWTTYTPTWTGAGSNPAIVNGTIEGRYLTLGSVCWFTINILMGSSTTYGSGIYSFGLPGGVTAKTGGIMQLVTVYARDVGTAFRVGAGRVNAGATSFDVVDDDNATAWGATVPHTWASTDEFHAHGSIEID